MLVTLGRGMTPLVGTLFLPSSLPDLKLWLDASDTSTITEVGGNVSQWDDKSGNSNHSTQPAGSYQPSTGINALNGKNILTFSEDYMIFPSDINASTVFCVSDAPDGGKAQPWISPIMGDGSGEYIFLTANSADSEYDISIDGYLGSTGYATANGENRTHGGNIDLGRTNAKNENPTVWTVEMDGAISINRIGTYSTSTAQATNCRMAEILIYDRALTPEEIAQTEAYLMNKWGIVGA